MTGPVAENLDQEYQPGAGWTKRAAGVAVFLVFWVAVVVWRGPSVLEGARQGELEAILAGVLVPLGLVMLIVYCITLERNARIVLSDEGLTVINWRKSRELISWDSVTGLVWTGMMIPALPIRVTYWLKMIARDSAGRPRRRIIWTADGSHVRDAKQLREQIVSRRGLSEPNEHAPALLWFIARLVGLREVRIWR